MLCQHDVGPDTELSARPYQRSSLASSVPSLPLSISQAQMGEKLNRIIKSEKDHIFKREIKIERAENGATRSNSTDGASTSALSSSSSTNCAKKSIDEAPVLIFLLFQKAIRSELDVLNSEAISLATGSGGDFKLFSKRFKFLFSIYEHHCNAEDEVGFVA
ncbi:uncharacterized protein A4U43_C01F31780 [Asparagus officinalis]|uniref:Uncharacterized protein n=1 Tax=Asparagus officinalis TaxID=4686 RepID=A0A5P1FX59_ASPOF|nr:uncharacterized protein A4U43_C01F31780 [Asparagus officinalis]